MLAINLKSSKFKISKLKLIYRWNMLSILLLMVVIMFTLGYFIFSNYTIQQVKKYYQIKDEEKLLKEELTNKSRLAKSIGLYQGKMAELMKRESIINAEIPPDDDLANLLIQINQLAEDSNVAINNLVPGTEERATGLFDQNSRVWSKNFALSATANYLDFMAFVYGVARFTRVIKLNNLQIIRFDQNGGVRVNLLLTVFYTN